MAMKEAKQNVRPPTSTTMADATGKTRNSCESLISRKQPAFTMVEECRSALVGVGATIAPRSHVWNGHLRRLRHAGEREQRHGKTNTPAAAGLVVAVFAAVSKNTLNRRDSP